ncbi:serine hydrolase domain-containing protein [Actinocorallia libanotica]|uniref:Serine hydrolase domain-containing protein n=1 Tax=Actinocorallia libanotica TaxID=46162 RepID=A0ABN1R901_9ACTN
MRRGKNWWRVIGAVVVGSVVLAGPVSAQEELDEAAVEKVVSGYADKAGYPGIVVAITKGDRVLHTGGYGRDSAGEAVTGTTLMPIASVSKSFTALAVMQLAEADKVKLDSPVRDYLPDFRISDSRGARVTVRELLNQTSGITDRTLPEKSLPQPDSLAGTVSRARAATLAVEPGTQHFYTNTNYHLAARLVEVVSGEPFADYLQRHVFEPAGMQATTTIDQTPRDLPSGLRKGHVYAYGASIAATEPKRFVGGSDGVLTTASDLAQWLIVQNGSGVAANGTRLLSDAGVKAMHTSSDRRWTYGMGWDTDQKGRVHHSGIWFTYSAQALLLPDGHGIAVVGNSGVGLANEGIGQLAEELAVLVEGGEPSSGAPVRLIVDLVLGALTLLSVFLGIRNLRRSRAWAVRFRDAPAWRLAPRLLPRLVPLALLVSLPNLIGLLFGGGRDVTFVQLCYYSIALIAWTSVAAVLNVGVLATRVTLLVRLRRSAADVPEPSAPAQEALTG